MKNKPGYLVVEKHYLNGEDFTDILGVFETIEEAEKCCRDRINANQINEEDLTDGRFVWFGNKNFTLEELIGGFYCSYLGIGKDDVIVEDYSLKIEEMDNCIEIVKEDN
jgi:hypothetical protein